MELAQEKEQKTSKDKKQPIRLAVFSLILILFFGAVALGIAYSQETAPVSSSHIQVLVKIPTGATTNDVSQILYSKGLIRNQTAFRIYARWHKFDGELRSGEYILAPYMSVGDILEKLKSGNVITYTFTIPEGFNTAQIADSLSKKGLINKTKFMDLVANGKFNYDFLSGAPSGERRLEGFLFPDTYKIEKGTKEEEIIKMMLDRFNKEITPEFMDQAKAQKMSIRQVVILASVIEREARTAGDRPLVSAVFHNRLKKNIKLESCATVQYIIGDPNKKILTYKDIAVDSKYNTYKYAGLPIAPIASPGKAALEAALNPAKVSYLYFVAKPDGSNEFSNTLAEHNAAKKKYLGNTK